MVQAFFQALVITLREGLEAFLIVAISLSYLRKSGRARLTPAVHWGIAAALVISSMGGYLCSCARTRNCSMGRWRWLPPCR